MNDVYPEALFITALTGRYERYIQQPWVKYNQVADKTEWRVECCVTLCVCEATEWDSPAGLRVYPELQGAVHVPFLFTLLHASHWYWMATAKHFSACVKSGIYLYAFCSFPQGFEVLCGKEGGGGGEGENKRLPALLPFFPLCGIKLHFEGECRHASHTRRSRETNRARFIKQRELLSSTGSAGC